ncbi:MAG: PH domain-containing protein [Bacteroidales bacterium]|nr:PH domain-containing protein [Bacteroidales bacterium]
MNKDKVLSVLSKIDFSDWNNLYSETDPDKNLTEKFQQAAKIHELEADEQILLLIDNSAWLSKDNTCVITPDRISLMEPRRIGSGDMIVLKWKEIQTVSYVNGQLVFKLKNKRQYKFKADFIEKNNPEKTKPFTEILNNIIEEVNKKEIKPIADKAELPDPQQSKKRNLKKALLITGIFIILGITGISILIGINGEKIKGLSFSSKGGNNELLLKKIVDQEKKLDNLKTAIESMLERGIKGPDMEMIKSARTETDKLRWTPIAGLPDSVNERKGRELQLAKNELLRRVDEINNLDEVELLKSNKYLLQNGVNTFSFALLEGDSLFFELIPDKALNAVVIDEERHGNKLFSQGNVKILTKRIFVPRADVINIKVSSPATQYCDVVFKKKPENIKSKFYSPKVRFDTLIMSSQETGAVKAYDLGYKNLFTEPYQVKLSSTAKSLISGESRVIIPVELPQNTVEWIYRIRISGNEEEKGGTLVNEVSTIKQEFNIMGFNVWSATITSSSLTRELLNRLVEPAKEESTCNVFFIDDKNEALKFQEHQSFKYNLDYSIKNTQSRNGLMKPNKRNFVYLGLESTRFTHTTYVWVEAIALLQDTYFYKVVRNPVDQTDIR